MDCAVKFEKDVAAIPGVTRAELNFAAAKLAVEGVFNPKAVSIEGSRHDITALPEGESPKEQTFWEKRKQVIISLISGLALLTGWTLDFAGASRLTVIFVFSTAIVIGGYGTARRAYYSLRKLNFDMNVLMTVAVSGAALIGEWSEGAAVAFLYSISNTLEAYTMEKARQSIKELMDIAPKEALIRRYGGEAMVAVDDIRIGDIMIVKPGEKIAMDGTVVKGFSTVNQAAITGESLPVQKSPGNEVFAGTLNQEGSIEIEVTKLVNDTTIAKIIHMVEEAQAQKAPSQRFVDRFAAVYTPIVITLAAGIVLVPPLLLGEQWNPWIYRGLAMMVVSCPCALVISTPVALVSAISNAARNGVLIKGGMHLEQAGSLSVVAFDKTGTMTMGEPVVTDIVPLNGLIESEVLAIAAGIEQLSEHPLAKAIVSEAVKQHLQLPKPEHFTSITGKGAQAQISGKDYFIGSPALFAEMGVWSDKTEELITRLQKEGKTAMLLGTGKDVLCVVAVADDVRDTGRTAVELLKQAGVKRTIMLTGDNPETARAIAQKVGIDEYYAELLPEEKVEAVKGLLRKYGKVAMIGDGINDAPALATATVGIAMGAAGTDTALETADIALMADDLSKIPFTIRLSKATLRVIKQNIGFALAIKLIAVLAIFPGWLTLWLAIMADMGASVLVTLNGIRLLRVRP